MSDNWIVLIPNDPNFIPDMARQSRARDRLADFAPAADEIAIKVCEHIEFLDCGANFERIIRPACRKEIPFEWWQDRVDDDYRIGFTLDSYPTPCCHVQFALHELVYEWPQGFGRFALKAMNPNIGEFQESYKLELEEILGTKLREIYQHI